MQRHMGNLHLDNLKISHFILFCCEFQGARSKGRWKESLLSVPNFVADAELCCFCSARIMWNDVMGVP